MKNGAPGRITTGFPALQITSCNLPSRLAIAIQATLRVFKFIPDEFVEPNDEQISKTTYIKKAPKKGAFVMWRAWKDYSLLPCRLPCGPSAKYADVQNRS